MSVQASGGFTTIVLTYAHFFTSIFGFVCQRMHFKMRIACDDLTLTKSQSILGTESVTGLM